MGLTMNGNKPKTILALVLIVSLIFIVSSWAEEQQALLDQKDIKPSWYKNGEYGAVYYSGDEHIITAVCDTKHGNLIYTIMFQKHTEIKVIQDGCPKDSKDYKNIKDR